MKGNFKSIGKRAAFFELLGHLVKIYRCFQTLRSIKTKLKINANLEEENIEERTKLLK